VTSVATWTGDFVHTELGIELHTDAARSVMPVKTLVGVALRRNPKRAQLLVSTVLAKHVPTVPGVSIAAGELLGLLVGHELDGGQLDASLADRLRQVIAADAAGSQPSDDLTMLRGSIRASASHHPDVTTIGYAETATGLGQLVAGTIGSYYIHSTRHAEPGAPSFAGFEEEHSHATSHRLFPTRSDWLTPGGTVVLVDDELSTGTTILNTITAIDAVVPQSRWIVASLIDLRSSADRARFDECASKLGTRISVVCLGSGSIDLPDNVLQLSRATIDRHASEPLFAQPSPGVVEFVEPAVAPVRSARFGVNGTVDAPTAQAIAAAVSPLLSAGGVLVLGTEEFIALPMAVADNLHAGNPEVRFSTTTRSPIAPIDRPDYAIESSITFAGHDSDGDTDDAQTDDAPRFAYNLERGGSRPTTVVLMPEPGTDPARLTASGGVVDALRAVVDRVIVVLLPTSTPLPTEWTAHP